MKFILLTIVPLILIVSMISVLLGIVAGGNAKLRKTVRKEVFVILGAYMLRSVSFMIIICFMALLVKGL